LAADILRSPNLRYLPVNNLKIDQSFVRDMLDDDEDCALVEGIMQMARIFKREVIAEGMETAAHGALLLKLGCDMAQVTVSPADAR